MTESFTKALAAFAVSESDPPKLARDVARLSALDWLACGYAGRKEPLAKILRAQALAEGGVTHCNLFGGSKVSARQAALVNGAISHALDYDDTHFAHIGHPSVAVYPAAFALGEKHVAPLPKVLIAALYGMEVSIRLGIWLGRTHYQAGFHQTATAGAFGALVAAGRLLDFTDHQMEQGVGLVASRAAGLKAQFGTMGKPYNAGCAASIGVEVAELVALGFEGNPQALAGPLGFGETHQGENNIEAALADLEQRWLVEGISHKFHACCHGLHAALEALRSLDVAEPEIARIDLRTHPRWMTVCNQLAPESELGLKFSYRSALAMMALGRDTGRLDSYHSDLLNEPKFVSLRDRIHVSEDPSLTETEAGISLLKRDGKRVLAQHDLAQELDYSALETRVRAKADSLMGVERAEEAWLFLKYDQELMGMMDRFMGG